MNTSVLEQGSNTTGPNLDSDTSNNKVHVKEIDNTSDRAEFQKRIQYLQNAAWISKKKLPLSKEFELQQQIPDTEIIYDFEAQENIYSISALYMKMHELIIWYYTDEPNLVDEQAVIAKALEINKLTITTYKKELQGDVRISVKPLTLAALQLIFEKPKRYVVGFNSNFYDLPLASYILDYGYSHNGQLPIPSKVRLFSNLLISPNDTIRNNYSIFGQALKALDITLNRKISLWDISKLYASVPYNQKQTCVLQGEAPDLMEVNRRLTGTGLHLDMRTLNEKDKQNSSSLKRMSAQYGYQIEEPEDVDLSSNAGLKQNQATNLLAYNASDVLVTTLIYQNSSYQDPLSTREDLLNTFDESSFKGRLTVNSTSAQFVELIIAPDDPLVDQPEINFFYPMQQEKYKSYQEKIDQDYKDKLVPYDANQKKHFLYWLKQTNSDVLTNVITEYQQRISLLTESYPEWNVFNSPDYVNYMAGKRSAESQIKPKLDAVIEKAQQDYAVLSQYCNFLNNNQAKNMLPLEQQTDTWPVRADRDSLDMKWTAALRHQNLFKAVLGPDNKMHEYARVKYGEIQIDLLEFMRLTFPKFPKEVYEMYSYLRGTQSIYDLDDNGKIKVDNKGHQVVLKTAREIGTEKFVNHYLAILGKDDHNRPIAPANVYYKYPQNAKVVDDVRQPSGVGVIIQVPDQPMVLSFSVGGVHGEVMNDQAYLRDDKVVKRYNNALKQIMNIYPDAEDFYDNALEHHLDEKLDDVLNVNNFTKTSIKLFITKSGKTIKYKALKKVVNPKDYVIPIDMHNAVHVDVDSLYPSLMINLHMFSTWTTEYNDPDKFIDTDKTEHWHDVYAKKRLQRINMKKFALETPKSEWTYVQRHAWSIQLTNKLILNSASGIADGRWPTNVRMNNKATGMRIIGQLALTYLVYRVEPKGVYSTSTNTDGVYLASKDPNFTEKDVNAEIEEWKSLFTLGATPEVMSHFVSKDSNNRFEQGSPEENGDAAGATIGNFTGPSSAKKMTQPFIIDAGIINYFKTHDNVCTTYDIPMQDLKSYLKEQQDIIINATEYTPEVRKAMLSFCWSMQPQKEQMYCLANKEKDATQFLQAQHVNRFLITKLGYYLRGFSLVDQTKSTIVDQNLTNWCVDKGLLNGTTKVAKKVKVNNFKNDWRVIRVNQDLKAYFKDPVWQNLDLDAYADFTRSRILGTDKSPIWVEPKFEPLNITANVDLLIH